MKILIIEDERLLAESLQDLLAARGFETEAAYDGPSGLARAERGGFGLLVLDVMLPELDGCQVARRLRDGGFSAPILMLTAKSDLLDRVEGLNAGADYYLPKPFDARELLACVNALLRRQGEPADVLTCGNTTLDLCANTLLCGENRVRLSAREFGVMRQLMREPDHNLSKEVLLQRVWGQDTGAAENHVEVYVGFLRKKLRSIGSNVHIAAARRLGYHLEVEEP